MRFVAFHQKAKFCETGKLIPHLLVPYLEASSLTRTLLKNTLQSWRTEQQYAMFSFNLFGIMLQIWHDVWLFMPHHNNCSHIGTSAPPLEESVTNFRHVGTNAPLLQESGNLLNHVVPTPSAALIYVLHPHSVVAPRPTFKSMLSGD